MAGVLFSFSETDVVKCVTVVDSFINLTLYFLSFPDSPPHNPLLQPFPMLSPISPMVSRRLATSGETFIAHHSPTVPQRGLPPPNPRTQSPLQQETSRSFTRTRTTLLEKRQQFFETESLIAHLSPSVSRHQSRQPPTVSRTVQSSDSESEIGDTLNIRPNVRPTITSSIPPFLTPVVTRRGLQHPKGVLRECHSAQSSPFLQRKTESEVTFINERTLSHEELAARAEEWNVANTRLVMYMRKDGYSTQRSENTWSKVQRMTAESSRQQTTSSDTSQRASPTLRTSSSHRTSSSGSRLKVPGPRRRFIKRHPDPPEVITLEVPKSTSPVPIRRVSHDETLKPEEDLSGSNLSLCMASRSSPDSDQGSVSYSPKPLRKGFRGQEDTAYEADFTDSSEFLSLSLPQPIIQTFHSPCPSPSLMRKFIDDLPSVSTSSEGDPSGPLSPTASDWSVPSHDLDESVWLVKTTEEHDVVSEGSSVRTPGEPMDASLPVVLPSIVTFVPEPMVIDFLPELSRTPDELVAHISQGPQVEYQDRPAVSVEMSVDQTDSVAETDKVHSS